MKNLILLLGLFLTPYMVDARVSLDDGKYFNHQVGKKVKINCHSNSIRVKGLINYDWVRFRECGRNIYSDRRGNEIRIIGRNVFEFRPRNRRSRMVFKRETFGTRLEHEIFGAHHGCTASCGPNCSIAPPPRYNDRRNDGYRSDDYRGGYNERPSYGGLEGVWYTSRLQRDVIIEITSEGLRAKFIGSDQDWTHYKRDRYDKDEYVDARGNRYVVRSTSELVWYPRQGGDPIRLTR